VKPPTRPPVFQELLKQLSPSRFLEILSQSSGWMKADRYLHWHDFRRRPAPAGFTVEEWWVGIKLGRGSLLRPVPLHDKAGQPFRFAQPDSLTELLHHIDRGLGATLGVPQAIDSPEARDRYIVRSLFDEAITSSQLEGAATTREVATEMLRSGRPPISVRSWSSSPGPSRRPQRIARCRSGFHPCQSHRRETHSGGFGIRCGRDWYSLSRRHSNPGRSSPDQTGRQLDSTEWLRLRRRTIATKPQPARIAIQSGEVTVSSPITRTAVAASARRANAVGTKSSGQSRTAMTVAKRAARIRRNRFMPPKHAAREKSYRACITALRGL